MAGAVDNSGAAQSVTAKDGMFIVDGKAMDLGTLMLSLSMEQTSLIDDQISAQMSQIQDQNDKLKELNDLLTALNKAKASGDKSMSSSLESQMKEFGLTVTTVKSGDDKSTRDSEWDANIQAVQGAQSGLNSDSQLSMTQLQQLINARNTSYDMASNFLSTDQKSKDTITNNL